jgi:hypothetical protein
MPIPFRLLHPVSEAEVLLGRSRASIYRQLRTGRLKAVKIRHLMRISASPPRFPAHSTPGIAGHP